MKIIRGRFIASLFKDIANSKPATGIDDRYPESSFFKVFPCENRRIDDSARGRVGNGACARRAPPSAARARCVVEPGLEGVIRQNTPKKGWRPLKTEPQPGDLPIFFFHGGSYFKSLGLT